MSNSDRVYRAVQPSDLPRIQAGTLKPFYKGGLKATLMSVRFGQGHQCLWLVENDDYDRYYTGLSNIEVDVTPTKRYAIWSHKAQKFVELWDGRFSTFEGKGGPYGNKADAEIAMQEMFKKYATSENQQKQFYVVEWEIKNDSV